MNQQSKGINDLLKSFTSAFKFLFSPSYRKSLNPEQYRKQKMAITEYFLNRGLYIAIIIFITFVAISKPNFLAPRSLINIMNMVAKRLPISLGIAGLIIINCTDLSAGRILGFTAIIVGALLQRPDYPTRLFPGLGNVPIPFALIAAILIGLFFGMFNGFFVAKFKIHPFIVTLGTQLIIQSFALFVLNLNGNSGQALGGLREDFVELITGGFYVGGIKIQYYVIYSLVVLAVIWFIWNKTVFGKNLFAIGSNAEAAEVSGINVVLMIVLTYLLAGILFGLNGFIESAIVGSTSATTGVGAEFDAIAACVIGGISFSGGIGKIRGVFIGVLLLQLISASFVFLGVAPEWQYAIKGAVIIITVAIDMRKTVARK